MLPSSNTAQPTRPRATAVGALVESWRRTGRAPGLVLGVWLVTVLAALPLAALLQEASTGGGGGLAVDGVVLNPAGVVQAELPGLAAALGREVQGAAGFVAPLSRLILSHKPSPALLGAVAIYLAVSIFLAGGVVDRLARARPLGASMFVALSGWYFARLLRLAAAAALVYWAMFALVYPLLFDVVARQLPATPGVLSGLSAVFVLLLGLVGLLVDFTRVRLVVEDRYSVVAAFGAALRFVRRRLRRVAGLYALNILVLFILGRFWHELAGGGGAGWVALVLSLIYLLARICARVAFLGSEAVFFQGELAHAHYTAAPLPRWPDSASVEAVRNLRRD